METPLFRIVDVGPESTTGEAGAGVSSHSISIRRSETIASVMRTLTCWPSRHVVPECEPRSANRSASNS